MPSRKKRSGGKRRKLSPLPRRQAPKPSLKRKSSRQTAGPPAPKKKPQGAGKRPGAVPPKKTGKTPKKPRKTSTKGARKPLKPVVIGGVQLPRKHWGARKLEEQGYTNGRLRKKLVAEIEALKDQLAIERAKNRKKKPTKATKTREQRGFDKLKKAIEEGTHPRAQDPKTGEEFYILIARLTQMSEREAFATLMGSPPDVGIAA